MPAEPEVLAILKKQSMLLRNLYVDADSIATGRKEILEKLDEQFQMQKYILKEIYMLVREVHMRAGRP